MTKQIHLGNDLLQISETACELTNIGIKHHADKATWHKFTHVYSKLFEYLGYTRDSEFTLLELGFSRGSSHLMWREYFPNATIIAIDINPWRWYQERERSLGPVPKHLQELLNTDFDQLLDDKFQLFIGDQKDIDLLEHICKTFNTFDVILDDASHKDLETKISFEYLFPHLKNESAYIIEDLHSPHQQHICDDIKRYQTSSSFQYLSNNTDIKSVSYIRMAYDLGLSLSLLPPHGNGHSDMGIIIKK
tara:strand:- start:13166 stop:13909 length:744 start_codon:yes stop_codon:yes gene_type:complete